VFSNAVPDTWGTAQRNAVLDGPKYVDLDATIAKLFSISRTIKGEFRVDILNALNTPHFDRPSGNFDSANFGQITAVLDSNGGPPDQRAMRFGLKFTF
jgi:hypothetical protein